MQVGYLEGSPKSTVMESGVVRRERKGHSCVDNNQGPVMGSWRSIPGGRLEENIDHAAEFSCWWMRKLGYFSTSNLSSFEACSQGTDSCSTSILPWAPAKCVFSWTVTDVCNKQPWECGEEGGYVGMSISSYSGAYNHREGGQVHPQESLQSTSSMEMHCSFHLGYWGAHVRRLDFLKNFFLCLIQSANHYHLNLGISSSL